MYKLTVLLTSLAILTATVWDMSAQNTEVKGRVTDTAGEPLVAVTVYESGNTSNGTVTDFDGYYSISVPPTATLVFSCLGFEERAAFDRCRRSGKYRLRYRYQERPDRIGQQGGYG